MMHEYIFVYIVLPLIIIIKIIEFNRTLNEFEHIEPFNRPLLPKQQSSKKFFAMIEILNQFILPKFVNNTTSFKKLHSIIYSGALKIIRLNGSKEIEQTNNIKAKELPKWDYYTHVTS
jgi:hypothetical protein